jgi:hypothetical protein
VIQSVIGVDYRLDHRVVRQFRRSTDFGGVRYGAAWPAPLNYRCASVCQTLLISIKSSFVFLEEHLLYSGTLLIGQRWVQDGRVQLCGSLYGRRPSTKLSGIQLSLQASNREIALFAAGVRQ